MSLRFVVLISGNGSNLQAMIDAGLGAHIALVLSDQVQAYGLQRAKNAGIPTATLSKADFSDRRAYDAALATMIKAHEPNFILLAGFMRILSADFVDQFSGKILNVHPSLLPAYPGLNTHQRVIDAGESHHGTSLHLVTAVLDGGPLIAQSQLQTQPGETAVQLQQRVQQLEHQLYPQILYWLIEGRLSINGAEICFDGQRLQRPLLFNAGVFMPIGPEASHV